MPLPIQIWSQYEQSFIRVIEQAESRDQIEKYYYTFTEYLSTQNHSMDMIDAMKPMIQSTMIQMIKKNLYLRVLYYFLDTRCPMARIFRFHALWAILTTKLHSKLISELIPD